MPPAPKMSNAGCVNSAGLRDKISPLSRGADATLERLPGLAEELARRNVKVVIATGNRVIAAAKRAGDGNIPIVALPMYDPINSEFIASYSRPGGNVTGLTFDVGPEEMGKRL